MIFTYNNRKYKTKSTLKDLEYINEYVFYNHCSGILTNLNLAYQGNFPPERQRCKTTVNDSLNKLKSLGVIYVTMQGGKDTVQVKNKITGEMENEDRYICGRHFIDKDRFGLLCMMCSFPFLSENSTYFKKNPPRLDFNRLIHFWDILQKTSDLGMAFRSVGIGECCDSDSKTEALFRRMGLYLFCFGIANTNFYNELTPKELLPRYALLNQLAGMSCIPTVTPLTVSLGRADNLPTPAAYDTPTSRISATYADAGACDGSLGDVGNHVKYEVSHFYEDMNSDLVVRYWSSSIVLGPGVSVTLSPDTSHVLSSSQYTSGFPHHTIPKLDKVWFTDKSERTYKETDMAILQPEEEYTYKSRPEIYEQIKKQCESQKIERFQFETETELTKDEIEDFKTDYANCLVRSNDTLRRCCHEVHRIRELSVRKDMHFNLNIDVSEIKKERRKHKVVYRVDISGRHHSPMANVPSRLRNIVAQTELSSLDLHGASFAILRASHKKGFDVDTDIKNDIINSGLVDYLNVDSEEKKELLKPILYRCIFSMDRNDAYNKYQYAFWEGEVDRRIRPSKFMELYDYVQEWVGGSEGERMEIFFRESRLELTVTRTLMELFPEGHIENVYDCFYYDPAHVKEADVKGTCSAVANEIFFHCDLLQHAQPGALRIRA